MRSADKAIDVEANALARRQARLEEGFDTEGEESGEGTQGEDEKEEKKEEALCGNAIPTAGRLDKYGLDLEVFKAKSTRKPNGWKRAVKNASEVLGCLIQNSELKKREN